MYDLTGKINYFIAKKTLGKRLEDEATEEFLKLLLNLMKLTFRIDPDYRENINNFKGSYRFKNRNGVVNVLVKFHDGDMEINEDPDPQADAMVTFKNSKALRNYLLSLKKDCLTLILNNEILVTGNLNYLYKFMFMANHPVHPLLNQINKLT